MKIVALVFLAIMIIGAWRLLSHRNTSGGSDEAANGEIAGLLDRRDILVIDTGTTGLEDHDVIVEIAAFDTTGAKRYHSYFVLPEGIRFHPQVSRVNGLLARKLNRMGAPAFSAEWPRLKKVLESAERVFSWNGDFDQNMLDRTIEKWGVKHGWDGYVEDIIGELKENGPELGSYRLGDAAAAFGIPVQPKSSHTTQGDARIALEVMRRAARNQTPEYIKPKWADDPATKPQLEYIASLANELGVRALLPKTKLEASQLIEKLQEMRD